MANDLHPQTDGGAAERTVALEATVSLERRENARAAAVIRVAGSFSAFLLYAALTGMQPTAYWHVYLAPFLAHSVAGALLAVDLFRPRPPRVPLWVGPAIDVLVILASSLVAQAATPDPEVLAMVTLVTLMALQLLSTLSLDGAGNHVLTVFSFGVFVAVGLRAGLGRGHLAVGLLATLITGAITTLTSRMRRRLALRFAAAESERIASDRLRRQTEQHTRVVEGLLAEARDANARLVRLQTDNRLLTQLIVHDLRAPLTAIAGNIEWLGSLAQKTGPSGDATIAVEESLHGIDRMSTLIGTLLDTAKLEEGRLKLHREPLIVTELLGRVARQARVVARARALELVVDALPADVRIDADRVIVQRLMENLASNATRFARDKGRVRIAAELGDGVVHLLVQNDGQPIQDTDKASLFSKYMQSDDGSKDADSTAPRPRAGWGLGLYFCRLAAEAHGGRIELADRSGWNTTFLVTLPRATAIDFTEA